MLTAEHESAIGLLAGCEDARVLRRFRPRTSYGSVAEPKFGLFVDCETTGLNTAEDEVIQFAAVRFEFDSAGNVGRVGPSYCGLEDPGIPLPREVSDITGLTDESLAGKRLDEVMIAALMANAVLVIAHNASFDRPIIERRLPGFDDLAWGCSQRDVAWDRFGCRGLKLDYLLMVTCGEFYDPHDALDDALVGIHVLATPRDVGVSPFQLLLDSVRTPTMRIHARSAPFAVKDRLRARRYQWNAGQRCWWIDVKQGDVEAEREWLVHNVYGGDAGYAGLATATKVSAKDRYSVRAS